MSPLKDYIALKIKILFPSAYLGAKTAKALKNLFAKNDSASQNEVHVKNKTDISIFDRGNKGQIEHSVYRKLVPGDNNGLIEDINKGKNKYIINLPERIEGGDLNGLIEDINKGKYRPTLLPEHVEGDINGQSSIDNIM